MHFIYGQKYEQFKYSVDLAACSHLEGEFCRWYTISCLLASEDMIAFQTMLILWNNLPKQRIFLCITGGEDCILCSKPSIFFLILFMAFPQWQGTIVSIHFLQIYFKCIRTAQNNLFLSSHLQHELCFASVVFCSGAWLCLIPDMTVWAAFTDACSSSLHLALAIMFFSLDWWTTCNSKWHSLSDI